MVGIVSGAYSSIFIAAPLLTILKEREPEYARRKAQAAEHGLEDGPEPDGGTPAPLGPQLPGGGPAAVEPGPVALETADGGSAPEQAPPPGEAVPPACGLRPGEARAAAPAPKLETSWPSALTPSASSPRSSSSPGSARSR